MGDSDRDISGLLDGRSYRSEAKGSVTTPHCIKEKADRINNSLPYCGWGSWGEGDYHLKGELISGQLTHYQGNQQLGHVCYSPHVNDPHKGKCFPLIN